LLKGSSRMRTEAAAGSRRIVTSAGWRQKPSTLAGSDKRELQQRRSIGRMVWLLAAALCLPASVQVAWAQNNGQQSPPKPDDNPFPEDDKSAPPAKPATPQSNAPGTAQPKKGSDNPFPGEDTNAPILPSGSREGVPAAGSRDAGADSNAGLPNGGNATYRRDQDSDPVRSPDGRGHQGAGDGFSSSLSGEDAVPEGDAAAGPPRPAKSKRQSIQEDLDVGGFYLQQRNWKAAQARFADAFALNGESPDAVWGLAESERHLRMYKEADEHYKLFLSYDPDGPHGKAARKALDEVEAALASSGTAKP
jgi:tetratricopeptide (TPR) repeat protein